MFSAKFPFIIHYYYFYGNLVYKITALKGKFHYSLPECLKLFYFEFSVKIGKLSTFTGRISTTFYFFVDKFFNFTLVRHHFLCYTEFRWTVCSAYHFLIYLPFLFVAGQSFLTVRKIYFFASFLSLLLSNRTIHTAALSCLIFAL